MYFDIDSQMLPVKVQKQMPRALPSTVYEAGTSNRLALQPSGSNEPMRAGTIVRARAQHSLFSQS